MAKSVVVQLRCPDHVRAKARYVFDTLFAARRVPIVFDASDGFSPAIVYGGNTGDIPAGALGIFCSSEAWDAFARGVDAAGVRRVDGVAVVFGESWAGVGPGNAISFDLIANAFYFLSNWPERCPGAPKRGLRALFADSVFKRWGIPQTIVDEYLTLLFERLRAAGRPETTCAVSPAWPAGRAFAVVLSHDEDFVPRHLADTVLMGVKSVIRQLVTHRCPADAARVVYALARAALRGRNPYRTVPALVQRERERGVRASYQIAVARRHPNDVVYRVEDPEVQAYLRPILDADFDVCLHGSYRSAEQTEWYLEEVETLARYLAAPHGSRQHYLAFEYDTLFTAQERAGIEYDMSIGYPDACGSRAGFSHPFFPYNLAEDRPFRVLEIPLTLMDVTLRSYLGLRAEAARDRIVSELDATRRVRGCVSTVWHPILFGGARDPGFDHLYWQMIDAVEAKGGWATDGRSVNAYLRPILSRYSSFCAAR